MLTKQQRRQQLDDALRNTLTNDYGWKPIVRTFHRQPHPTDSTLTLEFVPDGLDREEDADMEDSDPKEYDDAY